MKKWCHHQPMNLLQKLYIMEAEIARIQNRTEESLTFFEKAISAAKENEYLYDEAMAYELTGKFFLTKGNKEIATNIPITYGKIVTPVLTPLFAPSTNDS